MLHCKGDLSQSLSLMQQTEQMARHHDVWHYALWSLIQQSEIQFAQGFLQAAWETQERAFQLIKEQHLEQLPMHEFLVRIRAQLLWAWARLDEAEASARSGIAVLSTFQPQQQLQCLTLLVQCSLARGDLDNARSQLNRLENLLGNGRYHCDWISNADKVRVIYWQLTGDKNPPPTGYVIRPNRRLPITIFCKGNGGISPARRSCWANSSLRKSCWKS